MARGTMTAPATVTPTQTPMKITAETSHFTGASRILCQREVGLLYNQSKNLDILYVCVPEKEVAASSQFYIGVYPVRLPTHLQHVTKIPTTPIDESTIITRIKILSGSIWVPLDPKGPPHQIYW